MDEEMDCDDRGGAPLSHGPFTRIQHQHHHRLQRASAARRGSTGTCVSPSAQATNSASAGATPVFGTRCSTGHTNTFSRGTVAEK